MQRYGLLVHRHKSMVNIGDYIQGIAVKQALGLNDFTFIDREDIAAYQGEKLRVVGQGWYCHTSGAWPPSPQIDYLPFGIHINPQSHTHFLKADSMAALKNLAPIGCRDDITKEFLDAHQVESYFSSCLTLTRSGHLCRCQSGGKKAIAQIHAVAAVDITFCFDPSSDGSRLDARRAV